MKPEDKRYILENIGRKSVKRIAGELQIKERKVRKYIEKERLGEGRGRRPGLSAEEESRPTEKKIILVSAALILLLGFVV